MEKSGGSRIGRTLSWGQVAEAVGFEPTIGFPLCSVSNRVLSASQPRLRRPPFSQPRDRGQEGTREAGEWSLPCAVTLHLDRRPVDRHVLRALVPADRAVSGSSQIARIPPCVTASLAPGQIGDMQDGAR